MVELGRLVQASSSKPLEIGGTEPALVGACNGDDEGLNNDGEPVLLIVSEAFEIAFASTLVGTDLLGVGRPLLWVLFFRTPLGPANKFGAGDLFEPEPSSSCSCLANSSSLLTCAESSFGRMGLGLEVSMCFLTRMISPSRKPNERIVPSVISPSMASSILSRSNADAYRVQSSTSQPALRKNSNQSTCGFFFRGCCEVLAFNLNEFLLVANGSSSSDPLRGPGEDSERFFWFAVIFST